MEHGQGRGQRQGRHYGRGGRGPGRGPDRGRGRGGGGGQKTEGQLRQEQQQREAAEARAKRQREITERTQREHRENEQRIATQGRGVAKWYKHFFDEHSNKKLSHMSAPAILAQARDDDFDELLGLLRVGSGRLIPEFERMGAAEQRITGALLRARPGQGPTALHDWLREERRRLDEVGIGLYHLLNRIEAVKIKDAAYALGFLVPFVQSQLDQEKRSPSAWISEYVRTEWGKKVEVVLGRWSDRYGLRFWEAREWQDLGLPIQGWASSARFREIVEREYSQAQSSQKQLQPVASATGRQLTSADRDHLVTLSQSAVQGGTPAVADRLRVQVQEEWVQGLQAGRSFNRQFEEARSRIAREQDRQYFRKIKGVKERMNLSLVQKKQDKHYLIVGDYDIRYYAEIFDLYYKVLQKQSQLESNEGESRYGCLYQELAAHHFDVGEAMDEVHQWDVRRVLLSEGRYSQFKSMQQVHDTMVTKYWDGRMQRQDGEFLRIVQPKSLRYEPGVAEWVCFEYELQQQLVDPKDVREKEGGDTLIEPPRWTRTISGRTIGVETMCQYGCLGHEDKHRMSVSGSELGADYIDQEVLREVFARVNNWLMYHEWHPATYGFEQERLFLEGGEEAALATQITHIAYQWDLEYVDTLAYNAGAQKDMPRPPLQSLLLSRCASVRERARMFPGSLHFVFYLMFYGGRDSNVRQHLLTVGAKKGWEYIEKLRQECSNRDRLRTMMVEGPPLYSVPGAYQQSDLKTVYQGQLSEAGKRFFLTWVSPTSSGLGEVLLSQVRDVEDLFVRIVEYSLHKIRFYLQSATVRGSRWEFGDQLDFECVKSTYQLNESEQDKIAQKNVAHMFKLLFQAQKQIDEGKQVQQQPVQYLTVDVTVEGGVKTSNRPPPPQAQSVQTGKTFKQGAVHTGVYQLSKSGKSLQQVGQQPPPPPRRKRDLSKDLPAQQPVASATGSQEQQPGPTTMEVGESLPAAARPRGVAVEQSMLGSPVLSGQEVGSHDRKGKSKAPRVHPPAIPLQTEFSEESMLDFGMTAEELIGIGQVENVTPQEMQAYRTEQIEKQVAALTMYENLKAQQLQQQQGQQSQEGPSASLAAAPSMGQAHSGAASAGPVLSAPSAQYFQEQVSQPVASATGRLEVGEFESAERPADVPVPENLNVPLGGQGAVVQEAPHLVWANSNLPYEQSTCGEIEWKVAKVQWQMAQKWLEVFQTGREKFKGFSVRGLYSDSKLRGIPVVSKWEKALQQDKLDTAHAVPNFLDTIWQMATVSNAVQVVREKLVVKGFDKYNRSGDELYKRENKPFLEYLVDRGSQMVQAYNLICSRTTPAHLMCKRKWRHEELSREEEELVLQYLSNHSYRIKASSDYYEQLSEGLLCDKLFANSGGLSVANFNDVLSWHWLNLWKCPPLMQDNLRYCALQHYTTMETMLAEEAAYYEQLRKGDSRSKLEREGKCILRCKFTYEAGESDLVLSVTLPGKAAFKQPGFKLHSGVSLQQANPKFTKEGALKYDARSEKPREEDTYPFFQCEGQILGKSLREYKIRVTQERSFLFMREGEDCQLLPGMDRTNYEREMAAVRALPRYLGEEVESKGVSALVQPAKYDEPSFNGVGAGSSLTPYLTGNVSQELVDWDYRYPCRLETIPKETLMEREVEKNERVRSKEPWKAWDQRTLEIRAHGAWLQQQNKQFYLQNEAAYRQNKQKCMDLVRKLVGFMGYESESVSTRKVGGVYVQHREWRVKRIELNDSQLEALAHCVHHKIGIVQGPPGTGKSFVAALFTLIMLLVWKGGRIGVGAVVNHAVDNLVDEHLKLRFLPGSPYSSRDSIPPTTEELARGEPGLGERAFGRIGRHDMDWAPTYPWPGDYWKKRKMSWKPFSGNEWTRGDHTEVDVVRKQEAESGQSGESKQAAESEKEGQTEEQKLAQSGEGLISQALFENIIQIVSRQRRNEAYATFLPKGEADVFMKELREWQQREQEKREGGDNFGGQDEVITEQGIAIPLPSQLASGQPGRKSRRIGDVKEGLAKFNHRRQTQREVEKADAERERQIKDLKDLKYLDPTRTRYTFAKARFGLVRIGRCAGMKQYRDSEIGLRSLAEEYFNDPAAECSRVTVGRVSGQQAFAARRYLEHQVAITQSQLRQLNAIRNWSREERTQHQKLTAFMKNAKGVLSDLLEIVQKAVSQLEAHFLRTASVVVGTTSSFGASLAGVQFAVAIIEEGSQAPDAQVNILLMRGAEKLVFFGDGQQLSPYNANGDLFVRVIRGMSTMSRLSMYMWMEASRPDFKGQAFVYPIQMLRIQYRCPEDCYQASNERLYGGMVITGWKPTKLRPAGYPFAEPLMRQRKGQDVYISWIDTPGDLAISSGTSYFSEVEANVVFRYLDYLSQLGKDTDGTITGPAIEMDQVVVVCMYAEQANYLEGVKCGKAVPPILRGCRINTEFRIATVDSFQGRQADYIIICTTRSSPPSAFVSDDRRMNVASTRSRQGMTLIGDFEGCKEKQFYKTLCRVVKNKGEIVKGGEFTTRYTPQQPERQYTYVASRQGEASGQQTPDFEGGSYLQDKVASLLTKGATEREMATLQTVFPFMNWEKL